jgi:hypothetical protein
MRQVRKQPKAIRVRDLERYADAWPRPCLFCFVCLGEYSANASDYFMAHPETIIRCSDGHTARRLVLMTKRTVYTEVAA